MIENVDHYRPPLKQKKAGVDKAVICILANNVENRKQAILAVEIAFLAHTALKILPHKNIFEGYLYRIYRVPTMKLCMIYSICVRDLLSRLLKCSVFPINVWILENNQYRMIND